MRGLDEHSLLKREAVWSSLEVPGVELASLTVWGHRGGVENGDFCMLFWILPSQDASNAKLHIPPRDEGTFPLSNDPGVSR